MRTKALIIFFLFSFTLSAQQLADSYEISRSVGFIQNDFLDVNTDGIPDKVTLGVYDFAYYLGNGDGTFGMKQLIRDTLSLGVVQTLNFDYSDFNNNGQIDFVVAAGVANGVEVYMNNGNGFDIIALQNVDPNLKSVFCLDMTGDGLEDVLTGHRDVFGGNQQWIQIHVNQGDGSFASGTTLVTGITVDETFKLKDMDNDGDEDIVKKSTGTSSLITIIENTGTSFSSGIYYGDTGKNFSDFDLLDVDNDGLYDIVIPFHNTPTAIRWWKNMGNANQLTANDITVPSRSNIIGVTVEDINQDNKLDLVMTTVNIVYWYDHLAGTFQLMDTLASKLYYNFKHVLIDDLDGDSAPDISIFDDYGSSVYLNNGFTQFPVEDRITQMPKTPMFVDIKDIDNDGINDVIYSTGFGPSYIKDIVWQKSDGNNFYEEETIILRNFLDIMAYEVTDLDEDGDNDLIIGCISCSINSITYTNRLLVMWNDGAGNFSSPDDLGSIRARFIKVVDIDDDADNDIVVVSASVSGYYTVKIFWNNGSGFTEETIYYGTVSKQDVFVEDMNGDSKKDLVIKSTIGINTPGFEIWFNNGSQGFPSATPYASRNFQINVQDFDNDGDFDIMKSYMYGSNYEGIMLLKNDGSGIFSDSVDLQYFSPAISNSKYLYPYDLDDDSDLDLFTLEGDSIGYYENLGNGNFAPEKVIQGGYWLTSDLALGNIDSDSKIEIVLASQGHDQIMANQFVYVANTPILSISNDTVCSGSTVQIDVTNNTDLNENTTWALYKGSIGGTPDQISTTGNFIVTVDSMTNFYVCGYGGISLNGSSAQATIFVYQSIWEDTFSACDSFTWAENGITYTSSGDYSETYTSIHGCDSTIVLRLTINSASSGTESVIACNDFYWPASGMTYNVSGNYETTLIAANGCDSVINLNLTINPTSTGDTAVVECGSYSWFGNTYENSGTYANVLTNTAGCDSTITLYLTINQPTSASVNVSACDNYTWPLDGNTYLQSGQYTTMLINDAGCDSLVTLDLTISSTSVSTEFITACDSYTWIDGITYLASTSTPNWTFTNALGCDSTIFLDLTINASTSSTIVDTALDIYTLNGISYNESGTYTQIIPNAIGCDSIINLDLTIHHTGINELVQSTIEVFPNPSNGVLHIEWDKELTTVLALKVIDNNGRLVRELSVENNDHDLSSLVSGVYYIKIISHQGIYFKKWVRH